jgi:prepilin-type N-terminal cleavage/methylation domain-containing protein
MNFSSTRCSARAKRSPARKRRDFPALDSALDGESARFSQSGLRGNPSRAFTLIELLTVVAILGILSAIIIPTVAGARNSASKARTRAQFSQWASAFEQFKQEYGTYPQLSPNAALKVVNPTGTSTQVTGNHLFHDILAGVRRDGMPLTGTGGNPPVAADQNRRRIRFVSFTDSDFVTPADITAGRATTAQQWLIRDAFYNTSIAVVTDSNLDGVINGRDSTGGFPPVTPAGSTTPQIRPTTVVTTGTTGGTHAGVLFYCAPPGATTELDLIMSWR